jgi:AcrR family transcriptional regulator
MEAIEGPSEDPRQRAAATKRGRTKTALIAAATNLFNERGYDETSVDDIAKLAAVGVATAYNYFPAKDAYPRECLAPLLDELVTSTEQDLETGTDVNKAVARHLREATHILRANRKLLIAFVTAYLAHHTPDYAGAGFAKGADEDVWYKLTGQLRKLLEKAAIDGEIQPDMQTLADISDYHTKALVLRVIDHPYESEEETVTFVTDQLISSMYMGQVVEAFKRSNE